MKRARWTGGIRAAAQQKSVRFHKLPYPYIYTSEYTDGMAVSICVTLQKSARDASAYACWGNIPGALLSAVDVTGV